MYPGPAKTFEAHFVAVVRDSPSAPFPKETGWYIPVAPWVGSHVRYSSHSKHHKGTLFKMVVDFQGYLVDTLT